MARDDKYFAQFDGIDIAGTRYALGDEIDTSDLHPAVIEILAQQGQISSNSPAPSDVILSGGDVPASEDMGRADLLQAVKAAFAERVDAMSTGELRDGLDKMRAEKADREDDRGAGDGSVGGASYADLKDKPLSTLKTADLDTIAREEGVDFAGAKNNPERVTKIEDARKAKAAG